ncbi:hypothetical protein OIU74_003563 [Salix koriyanagi]|uniref:Uncharacterized protein n=1 Tax=Salix koriyanagi TaxID=2511006 RepID=A0A9Q0UYW0_9ROSI|nr:hypothetical protein OIU74_003563 [Salix koriyanagi]
MLEYLILKVDLLEFQKPKTMYTTRKGGVKNSFGAVANFFLTSFGALVDILFPCRNEIVPGSNRAVDLKDTQHAKPIGTLVVALTTTVYNLARLPSLKRIQARDSYANSCSGLQCLAKEASQRPCKEKDGGISQCNLNLDNEWRKADNLLTLVPAKLLFKLMTKLRVSVAADILVRYESPVPVCT